jgi:hypothetical protein
MADSSSASTVVSGAICIGHHPRFPSACSTDFVGGDRVEPREAWPSSGELARPREDAEQSVLRSVLGDRALEPGRGKRPRAWAKRGIQWIEGRAIPTGEPGHPGIEVGFPRRHSNALLGRLAVAVATRCARMAARRSRVAAGLGPVPLIRGNAADGPENEDGTEERDELGIASLETVEDLHVNEGTSPLARFCDRFPENSRRTQSRPP